MYRWIIVAVAILPFYNVVSAQGNTFIATKNRNLTPLPLDLVDTAISNIEVLVSTTKIFKERFSPNNRGSTSKQVAPLVELVRGSEIDNSNNNVRASPFGFVGSVAEAYAKHHNLVIRPDDIWQAIISQFSMYVRARGEELRDVFVEFEGKEKLYFEVPGTMRTFQDWDIIPPAFLDLIADNVKDETIVDWFLPDFSTTLETDRVGAAAAAMCAFENYFTYTVGFVCGIPQITLQGTLQDWQNIRERVDRLVEFDDGSGILTDAWVPMLRDILDEFVLSISLGSTLNIDFWDQIMHSATLPYLGEKLSGWIITFSFFDEYGKQAHNTLQEASSFLNMPLETVADILPWGLMSSNDVNPNVLSCPISIVDLDGEKYNSTLFVGQMSFEYSPDISNAQNNPAIDPNGINNILAITPRTDWAIVVDKNDEFREFDDLPQRPPDLFPALCVESRLDPICERLPDNCVTSETAAPAAPMPELSGGCFSKTSFVIEKEKGLVQMKELQIGDMIKSSHHTFSRIYSFGHQKDDSYANFLQIHYSSKTLSGSIEMTEDHLLLVNDSMIPASFVEVGDRLSAAEEDVMVEKIRVVRRKGVYAPFTESGTIVVNGIVASSYISLQSGSGSLKISGIDTGMNMHQLSHYFQCFHRAACKLRWSWCANEKYTDEGVSTWVDGNKDMFLFLLRNATFASSTLIFFTMLSVS
eukprot:CAMPEP_0178899002 /NCGR_PEP_ID=MMETSP0786-20121207/2652_1 /TAXON_ID=186022 /ORGANISM="Thalassionema frauenfeldii, Strain CCMP 1798" /LENGTH=697 /DNA_ID=CAMNT_0020569799 /DNA_START=113 /DNA_END=2203 /DNA_ORIENTATION=-